MSAADITGELDHALDRIRAGGHADEAGRLHGILHAPPRVALVGRVKMGKSTLLNALIGAKVAATAALECTNAVSVYRHGQPERAIVNLVGGGAVRPDLVGQELRDLGVPPDGVAHVDRYVSSGLLRRLTLLDTPGTATLTLAHERATRRALADSARAEACLYLTDSAPRDDEREVIGSLGFTPAATVAVLSRADSFGEGAFGRRDPVDHARAYAGDLAGRLADLAHAVVPVSGLLAETSSTGAVTEDLARELGGLAHLDAAELIRDLERAHPVHLDPGDRARLLDAVGAYGILHGRAPAAHGALALRDWLRERSGIDELRARIDGGVADVAALARAGRILAALESLAYRDPAVVRPVVEGLRRAPELRRVRLHTALADLAAVRPGAAVAAPMVRALTAGCAAAMVGLPPEAPSGAVRTAVDEAAAPLRARLAGLLDPAEENAITALLISYDTLREAMAEPGATGADPAP